MFTLYTGTAYRIGSSTSGAPITAPMRIAARPNAFENVRPTITLGNAGSSGIKDRPENSAYASSTNTIASFGTRVATVLIASNGTDTPVGLLGLVMKTIRVAGVIAASTSFSGNSKSGFGITCTSLPPATAVSNRKISNAGSGTRDSGRRLLPPEGR